MRTSVCYEKKTANQTCAEVLSTLDLFELHDKVIHYVTDADATMKAAMRIAGVSDKHHLCIGHGLHNLVTKDGIEKTASLESVCSKSKTVCKKVRFKLPDVEREARREQNAAWLDSVMDVISEIDLDDADPIANAEKDPATDDQDSDESFSYFTPRAPTTVKLPVPTRWHTMLTMLESLDKNKASRIYYVKFYFKFQILI